ncbi:ABC transporter permease [Acidobacteriota bacterium]
MVNINKLAWRNIGRNRRRTLLTVTAIALSILFLIFLQSYIKGIIDDFAETFVKNDTGHVKIAAKEFLRKERILPKEHLIFDYEGLRADINKGGTAKASTARIKFLVVLSHEADNEGCMGIGIEPETESDFMDMKQYVVQGRYIQPGTEEIVIGRDLAEELGVTVDDEVLAVTTDINYSTYALTFKVVGIFDSGFTALDKHLFYLPIDKAQQLLDCEGAAHEILFLFNDPAASIPETARIKEILAAKGLDEELTAVPWQDHYFMKNYLPFVSIFLFSMLLIIMSLAGLVILNTMLMAVLERTHEIGIIKALGMKDKRIRDMILVESLYIGIIGVIAGGLLGGGLSLWLGKTGIDLSAMMDRMDMPGIVFNAVIHPKLSLNIMLLSMGFGLIAAVAAAVYPARKGSKLPPVEALRSSLK